MKAGKVCPSGIDNLRRLHKRPPPDLLSDSEMASAEKSRAIAAYQYGCV